MRTWLRLLGVLLLVAGVAVGHGARRRAQARVHERLWAGVRAFKLARDGSLGKSLLHARDVSGVPARALMPGEGTRVACWRVRSPGCGVAPVLLSPRAGRTEIHNVHLTLHGAAVISDDPGRDAAARLCRVRGTCAVSASRPGTEPPMTTRHRRVDVNRINVECRTLASSSSPLCRAAAWCRPRSRRAPS